METQEIILEDYKKFLQKEHELKMRIIKLEQKVQELEKIIKILAENTQAGELIKNFLQEV